MSKKFSLILIILIILAALAGIYFYFFPQEPKLPQEEIGFGEFVPLGGDILVPIDGEIISEEEERDGREIILLRDEEIGLEPEKILKLVKISNKNIAGFEIFKKTRNKIPEIINPKTKKPETEEIKLIRYSEKVSGSTFERFLNNSNELEIEKKIAVANIPYVEEAFFANNGQNVILRYAKENFETESGFTIETYLGLLPEKTQDKEFIASELRGNFLEQNLTDLSVSVDGKNIFYLLPLEDKISGLVMALKDNSSTTLTLNKKSTIFNSTFTEWRSQYVNEKSIGLTTKATSRLPSFAYLLDIGTKIYQKVLGDINGATVLWRNDAKKLIYSNNFLELNLYDLGSKETRNLGLKTLTEKCLWVELNLIYCAVPKVSEGSLPDDWYQGLISFNDSFWKIDTKSGTTTMIFDPENIIGEKIDGLNLKLDSEQKYLFFTNKKDNSIWVYKLN